MYEVVSGLLEIFSAMFLTLFLIGVFIAVNEIIFFLSYMTNWRTNGSVYGIGRL